jgi:hypothetical protein
MNDIYTNYGKLLGMIQGLITYQELYSKENIIQFLKNILKEVEK